MKVTLLLAIAALSVQALTLDCSSFTVATPNNLVWNQVVGQLPAGQACKVDTSFDVMLNFLSPDLTAIYYTYKVASTGQCQAVGGQANYYSGDTLLTDYNEMCGFEVVLTNGGSSD